MGDRIREIKAVITGVPVTDGAGVKITRIIGSPELNMLDPFLLFDVFESDQSQDYIGGFPEHPHRGFETVTYLLNGKMRHKDSAGHEGVIESGGVQWMTAGRGVLHSEMPEQEQGLLHGVQLWVNLPAKDKMNAPGYQEFSRDKITIENLAAGGDIRVIAGTSNKGTTGPVTNHYVNPVYMDVSLSNNEMFEQRLDAKMNGFVYILSGTADIGKSGQVLRKGELGVLGEGDQILAQTSGHVRFLLIAANPINEPVARAGPFVMSTKAEVLQAFDDLHNNRF